MTTVQQRLEDDGAAWRRWGPYLSERAWGTVREDYSPDGSAWEYLPYDQSRSKTYRWNEDGIAGISDDKQHLCFALAMWNGHDSMLKERLFGLTGPQGNHGEDVKEIYYYLDSTPCHSYMKMLYKYPQAAFPYEQLVNESARRTRQDPEYELLDTGVFNEERYFDVFVEYAKASPDDILIKISIANRGPETAGIVLLPTLWFRNTWVWGWDSRKPELSYEYVQGTGAPHIIKAQHHLIGKYYLYCENSQELLFVDNETNTQRLYDAPSASHYVKDGINDYIVNNNHGTINWNGVGTKAAARYTLNIASGQTATVRLRFAKAGSGLAADSSASGVLDSSPSSLLHPDPFGSFDTIFAQRLQEADEFYAALQPVNLDEDSRNIQRQAFAGMLWSKQFYHYIVGAWLNGDPNEPPPPTERKHGRNADWKHLYNERVMSMPDKWEYPWYAAWDLAFHCITLALIDREFAKSQLDHLLREWYQHPNGQIPAYEWAFGDVNPPVLAWAAWRVYKIDQKQTGGDRAFLETVFHKLLLNFTWWVNRKDSEGNNIFQGGFLGLDNIGVFDRSAPLPTGGHLEQSDGTSWMGMFCLNMLQIALELSRTNPVYENIATKFFEHFLGIAEAMNDIGKEGIELWDDEDEFFYDAIHLPDGSDTRLRLRSLVGLIPLLAVETVEPDLLELLPEFKTRLEWYLQHRPEIAQLVAHWAVPGTGERRLLALVRGHRMKLLLGKMLDPNEFLSDYGIRSVSKYHQAHPFKLDVNGMEYTVNYEPAESRTNLFGGNSNWRGPVWFPINYLLIESLQTFHHYYGDDFKVECPTGSGIYMTLSQIADDLSQRLIKLFQRNPDSERRPVYGWVDKMQYDPHWRDYVLFFEYFHGDNGAGLGASHQTGWTGLVAKLIQQQAERANSPVTESPPSQADTSVPAASEQQKAETSAQNSPQK